MQNKTVEKLEAIDAIKLYTQEHKSITYISQQAHVGKEKVKIYLQNNGITLKGLRSNINREELCNRYLNGESLEILSEQFGIKVDTIKKYLQASDVKIKYSRSNSMDDLYGNIFDCIDTEEKAYWLGFIFADGYISQPPRPTFAMNLSYTDITHMEKLKKFLNYKNDLQIQEIYKASEEKSYKLCRMKVDNKNLWDTLNSYGCTPKKSLTLKFPQENIFVSKDLIRHFIRGYVDGDGCITYANKKYAQLSILGTKEFLAKLQEYLPCEDKNLYLKHPENNTNTYTFLVTNKIAYDCMDYLYNNATIYLDRKYVRYLEFRRLYKELYKELETQNGELCDENTVLNSEVKDLSQCNAQELNLETE